MADTKDRSVKQERFRPFTIRHAVGSTRFVMILAVTSIFVGSTVLLPVSPAPTAFCGWRYPC